MTPATDVICDTIGRSVAPVATTIQASPRCARSGPRSSASGGAGRRSRSRGRRCRGPTCPARHPPRSPSGPGRGRAPGHPAARRAPQQPPPCRRCRRRRPAPRRGDGRVEPTDVLGRLQATLARQRPGLQHPRRAASSWLGSSVRRWRSASGPDQGVRLLRTGTDHAAWPVVIDGDRPMTPTPLASSADATVSPAKPVIGRPSNANAIGRARSMPQPPLDPRDVVTARSRWSACRGSGRTSAGSRRRGPSAPATAPSGCREGTSTPPTARRRAPPVRRIGDARLAAIAELGRVARPAMRARDQQHGPAINARPRRRRARR